MSSVLGYQRRVPAVGAALREKTIPGVIFAMYCYFLFDYFFRLAARYPFYAQLRPTLVMVLLISFALLFQADRYRSVVRDPRVMVIWALIAYLIVSLPLVEWPGSVVRHHVDDFVRAVVFLFFTAFIVDTDRRLKVLVGLWLALQVHRVFEPLRLNIMYGYWGSATHLGHGEFADRLAGAPADVINPNELGFVIVTAIPFLHFLLGGSPRWSLKLLYLLLLPPLLYALLLTGSRGAFLAGLVVVGMIFWESRRKALVAGCIILIAIGGWSQMSDTQRDRYRSIYDESAAQYQTAHGRQQGIIDEFRLGLNRPVFGHGLGTTKEAKVHYTPGRAQASHNLYAELLIEIGVIGAAVFMYFLWLVYRLVRHNLRRMKTALRVRPELRTSFEYRLNQALLTTFLMYAVYSINYWGLSQSYWYLFAGFCIAFARSINRNQDRLFGSPPERQTPVRPVGEK
ncbi:O-antigen ligase family protein [Methylonatrum kenyense]|uniref:O-antigen ligase family protein n=1 Tax=Methylonatrum kenyense TaxID=455253 RepID=UPI0020C04B13|nr:O-antigen ligase family protein [Methylonatrum kenyense]MCK8516782.1 O-antigen ligase family protein [Methylonatrum kenyense]